MEERVKGRRMNGEKTEKRKESEGKSLRCEGILGGGSTKKKKKKRKVRREV